MPALFLAVAAMVLNVLMTRIAQQQRTIVGTLKALGYSNRLIFTHYIQFGITVGFAGGLGGWAIGWWMSGYMTHMYQAVFEFPSLANTFYPGIMAAAMLISVVFAILGTLHGVKTVARLNPAEAMRMPAPPAGGAVFLERFPRLWKKFDFRWQMILRGVLRNRVRTLISILAAALGASIVVVAMGLVDSMNKMISFQFDKIVKSDFTLSFRDEAGGDAELEVRRMPGVLHAEAVFHVPGTFEQGSHWKKGVITGLPSGGTLTVPHSANGEAVPVPPVGLLMTRRMADQLQLNEGDLLRFTPVRGLRTPHEVRVVKIISSMLGMAVYADYTYLNHLMGESDALSEIQMKTAFTPAELNTFYRRLKESPRIQAVHSIREQKAAITRQFQASMQGMAVMLVIFAAVIFFGSILNGSLIALAERNREIATFRVLGYTPMDVGTIFLRENLLLNLIGTVVGMPLGYLLLYGMCSQFANDAFIFPTYVRGVTWINTFVLAFLFVLGAQLVVRRSILKMDWGEALSMKE
ncbi:MAG: FtsX-like permease family protein, partial [Kiritimatiellae bacterium]|nr:FtsX-like permease family protein [Kiritimatiellia bacterium]